MRALLLLLRTSRFDLDFICGWKMVKTTWFLPTSTFKHTHPWRVCDTRQVCCYIIFSYEKVRIQMWFQNNDLPFLHFRFIFAVLHTVFHRCVSCACVCAFSACLSFYLFSLQPRNAGATIKSKSEKKNEWIGSCRVRYIRHLDNNFFFALLSSLLLLIWWCLYVHDICVCAVAIVVVSTI